jgi:transcriptional regulator with PAS, ATPase and Fis domain
MTRRQATPPLARLHGLQAVSSEMRRLFPILRRAARADCTVLISGETGTGKELAARAIHLESARRASSFVAVNCAAFSPTLLESALFGHVRGAFTGAVHSAPGVFNAAQGGTLFLDEIADMPLDLQAKVLRVLQEKSFIPLGATRPHSVDVRVISATNKVIADEVASGRFRPDLAYRLRVVPIWLPPLRERRGDVEALFAHFVEEHNEHGLRRVERIDATALAALRSHGWPGNVRELHSVVEYAFVMGEGPVLTARDLPPEVRGEPEPGGRRAPARRERERERILRALDAHRGRKGAAAEALGMSRSTLWRKLAKLGLD